MAIMRYDIEVERTVTVTATPQPRNSRHAVKSIGWRLIATLAITGLAVLVVLVIQGMAEDWREASRSPVHQFKNPLSGFGNAPDSPKPPPVKSNATKAKPKTPPVERTDIESAQREPESGVGDKYNYGGGHSTWCTGTANLPPVPAMCEWVRSSLRP
jgi:hypothetical protein